MHIMVMKMCIQFPSIMSKSNMYIDTSAFSQKSELYFVQNFCATLCTIMNYLFVFSKLLLFFRMKQFIQCVIFKEFVMSVL